MAHPESGQPVDTFKLKLGILNNQVLDLETSTPRGNRFWAVYGLIALACSALIGAQVAPLFLAG